VQIIGNKQKFERQFAGSPEPAAPPSAGASLHTHLLLQLFVPALVHKAVESVVILLLYILAKCALIFQWTMFWSLTILNKFAA
jgi:hypothetical protein